MRFSTASSIASNGTESSIGTNASLIRFKGITDDSGDVWDNASTMRPWCYGLAVDSVALVPALDDSQR